MGPGGGRSRIGCGNVLESRRGNLSGFRRFRNTEHGLAWGRMSSSPPAGLSARAKGPAGCPRLRARPPAGRLCLRHLRRQVDPDPARLPARPAQSPSIPLAHQRRKGGSAGTPATRRGASVVVFRAEVGDQVLASQPAQRILQLHQLDEQIVLGIELRRAHRRLEIEAQPLLDAA